jgi:predicted O-linked N-acetylglucosamine transferase (SPINDLY family)/predicted O-methyltransferase YrrM/SAM-dependent methyltransferase
MNQNQHILLYTDDPSIYGVGQYNHTILCELARLGYKVTCVQSQASNLLIQERQQLGIQHLWLDYDTHKEFGRTLIDISDAQNILDTQKPDLVIFSDCCPLSNLAAKKVANQMGIPYVVVEGFVAPYLAERFAPHLNELEQIYTQAEEVIAVSTENLNLLHQLFKLPKGKGQVIYYGRPKHYFTTPTVSVRDRLRQEFEIPAEALVCFTAARLEPVKGFQYQLEAIKQLKQNAIWSQIYFIWAGTGSLENQLKAELEQLGVTKQVKLIGERSDIKDWLDAVDIFILPSQLEGMPLSIMEAMAKGLPVIATAVSGIPEELGETGKLLSDPKIDPQATIRELANTIRAWTVNSEERYNQGQAAKQRAETMFKEEKMVEDTLKVLENSLLSVGDYISPGFSIIQPDRCFPNMIVGDTRACGWSYLRREIPHNWYVDKRQPTVGFLSRDEAHILYNTALKFQGKKALEIGCWLGWSACHLALAGVELDVIDPLLDKPEIYDSVSTSLKDAGVFESINLVAGYSPQKVEELAKQLQRKWSLIFIDGDHDAPGPLNDAIICEQLAETDALILFHDLSSPDVAQGLDYLKQRGWNTMVYQTMQIMGVAWRGNIEPVWHQPDPEVKWNLPKHLQHYIISGASKYLEINSNISNKQESKLYTQKFYQLTQDGSRRSAQVIVPLILELTQSNSVIDIGCGVGTWLSVFEEFGITDYLGIDGEYVDKNMLQVSPDKFIACDLKNPPKTNRNFDLVISMEVAEHLPQKYAYAFTKYLTSLGKIVIFSAAIPYQGGEGHINEQWPQYWVQMFRNHGYVGIDCLREKIWNHPNVEPWYAQNIFIFVSEECLEEYPYLAEKALVNNSTQLAIVHPRIYINSVLDNSKEFIHLQNSPLVSVVIPCCEQAHFLPEAVASVVAQTYENWEIIIVNDGSTDNTSEVVQQLIKLYSHTKVKLVEKENGGLASARNAGIAVTKGEYILPLDADDKLDINSISHLVTIAVSQEEFCIAFGSYQMFGIEQKQVISVQLYSPENIKSFNMLHPSSLFPKEVWKLVGGYRTDMIAQGYEDWNFWLSCHQKNISFRGTKEITTYYRRHSNSMYLLESQPNHNKLYAELVLNHPQLFGIEQIRESANIIMQVKNIIEDLSKFELPQIHNIIESYQTKPFDSISLANICDLRKQITDLLLSLDHKNLKLVFLSDLSKVYQMLLNSGIKNKPLNDKEQNLVNELLKHISKGFEDQKAIQYFLVAMLYQRADQLQLQPDLTHIPQWLLEEYLKYLFEFPRLFQEIGEADNYYRYLEQWLNYLQENISNNPESTLWEYIAKFFLQNANFIPLYFTKENVKDIYIKRADIIELALNFQGCQIDYDLPERPIERKKIRLGILAAHFQPSTETFHTLPAYKHLDWNNFEIIFYTVSSNNSRLERYCAGHADALVTLPSDLQSQVQTIRDANLDILLIATNVTAVTNQITLLALHRLARIQVTFGSCPTTTGIRNIDYFISGSLSEPTSDEQEHYREKLVTVDGVGYCFDYPHELDNPTIKPNREDWGATEKTIVFTSGANCYKIIPELRETWAKILAAVPDSILVLYPFSPSWSNSYPANAFLNQMHTVLAKYGVDKNRLIVLDTLPSRADVKEVLKLADVYLDSYRHSGGHSLVDALEVGLPTVVLEGNALRARHGTAYLRQIQIFDLITDNEIDYIQLAVKLGTNPELRKQKSDRIKQKMQQNPSFLDSRSYSAQMDTLFQQLFQEYQAKNLIDQLGLRDINLVMFPDWHQSEESLYENFANVLKTMSSNPDKSRMTLLIDTDGIDGEDANWMFSSVAMNLLMEEAVGIADELEVSLLDDLSENEWELLLSLLQGRIILDNENQNAIAKAKAESLTIYS